MTSTVQRIPSFLTKSSQELKYPTDKLLVYSDGRKQVYEKGSIRNVGSNELVNHGELIIAFPHVKYYYLNYEK